MPGFVSSVNSNLRVGLGASHLFSLSYVLGFVLAALFSWILHVVFPYDYQDVTELETQATMIEGVTPDSPPIEEYNGNMKEANSVSVEMPEEKRV